MAVLVHLCSHTGRGPLALANNVDLACMHKKLSRTFEHSAHADQRHHYVALQEGMGLKGYTVVNVGSSEAHWEPALGMLPL